MKKIGFTLAEVPEARQHIRHWSKGFTLAEVLITLAIIGIVAALTIPTLVQNFQSRAWDTASEVFQRKLEESLKVMNVQGTLAGYTTTEAFVDELSKHIKITKICKNDDITSCFEDKVYWGSGDAEPEEVDMTTIKEAKHFGQDEWETETIGVQFANGTNAVIAYNPECRQDPYSNQVTGTSCLAILYDTSAYKNPNTGGKDLRGINIKKLGSTCAVEVDGICFTTAFIPNTPMTRAECLAEQEKLKIPACCLTDGSYGGDSCGNKDYWGAAVRTCGGVDHMPSKAQLRTLVNYLFDGNVTILDDTMGPEDITYDKWNDDKVASLGINPLSGEGMQAFVLFSNELGKYHWRVNVLILYNNLYVAFTELEKGRELQDPDSGLYYAICVE